MSPAISALLLSAAVLATILPASSKTVVFFPMPTGSYVIYHANIGSAVASLGHDVWICVPHYLVARNLVKHKSVKVLEYGKDLGDVMEGFFKRTGMIDNFWAGKQAMSLTTLFHFYQESRKISAEMLSDVSLIEQIKNVKADLFVLESTAHNLNMLVIPYKLDIPYALIGTIHDVILSRVPFSPAATPSASRAVSDQMTFWQRLAVTLSSAMFMTFEVFYDSSLVSRFAPEKPYMPLNNLAARAEIFIAELDYILDYPRPMLPNTKLIGGSSASPATPLAMEFEKFVNESTYGIVVASFGSSVLNIPPEVSDKMTLAFKQLDQRVVWRVNVTSADPNHTMTAKWIPQNDLLGHDKTKLFVSHCGKNGQYESLYHGVPILCLPIYGDQPYNAERIRIKELGLSADIRTISADQLAAIMRQIITDSKYTKNMKKASRLYRELFKVPMNEAAYWLDHVMEYGGEYMRSASQTMPLYQFLILDVLAFIVGVCCLSLVLTVYLVKFVGRLCRRKNVNTKLKQS